MVCPEPNENPLYFPFPDNGAESAKDDLGRGITIQALGKGTSIRQIGLGEHGRVLIIDNASHALNKTLHTLIAVRSNGTQDVIADADKWKKTRVHFVNGEGRILVQGIRQSGELWRPEDVTALKLFTVKNDQLRLEFESADEMGPDGLGGGFASLNVDKVVSLKRGEVYFIAEHCQGAETFPALQRLSTPRAAAFDQDVRAYRLPRMFAKADLQAAFLRLNAPSFLISNVISRIRGGLPDGKFVHHLFSIRSRPGSPAGSPEALVRDSTFPSDEPCLFSCSARGESIAGVEKGGDQRLLVVDTEDMSKVILEVFLERGSKPAALSMGANASRVCLATSDPGGKSTTLSVYDLDQAREAGVTAQLLKYTISKPFCAMLLENGGNILLASGRYPSKIERISF